MVLDLCFVTSYIGWSPPALFTLQFYEKKLNYANISATFFIQFDIYFYKYIHYIIMAYY